jgi:ParB/RepB/Spo0J family partition protein
MDAGTVGDGYYAELPLEVVEADPNQHRREFDEKTIRALAENIRLCGLRSAIEVYPVSLDAAGSPTRYRVLTGERRLRAVRTLGLATVQCKVLPAPSDEPGAKLASERAMRAENVQREDLSILDDAYSLARVLAAEVRYAETVGSPASAVEMKKRVAAQERLSSTEVYARLGLLEAPPSLREALARASGARSLSRAVAYSLMKRWREALKAALGTAKAKAGRRRLQAVLDFDRKARVGNAPEKQEGARETGATPEAIRAYAVARSLDPKKVAREIEGYLEARRTCEERFAAVVRRAVVESASSETIRTRSLRALQAPVKPAAEPAKPSVPESAVPEQPKVAKAPRGRRVVLHTIGESAKAPLVIYRHRIGDPDATPEARAELRRVIEEVGRELAAAEGPSLP